MVKGVKSFMDSVKDAEIDFHRKQLRWASDLIEFFKKNPKKTTDIELQKLKMQKAALIKTIRNASQKKAPKAA